MTDVKALEAEIVRLRRWIADLQSGMYVNCVYCGHRYGPGETTPVTMADALKAHITQCREHPMARMVDAINAVLTEVDEAKGFGILDPLHPICMQAENARAVVKEVLSP